MKKTSFATGLSLVGLSAARQRMPEAAPPAWTPAPARFEFAPWVLQGTEHYNLTHEICSRAVDRLLHRNVDFNEILEANTGYWKDESFTGWDRIFWDDYRPHRSDEDESPRQYDSEFKRIKDVFSSAYSLWGHEGITFSDPRQGFIGDCWMIAASSVTAQNPDRIKEIFHIESLNSAGVYAVDLFIMGIPVTVTIDDYLPFWKNTNDLLYAQVGPDHSLWMPILEKAAAKLYGNYEVMVGGWMGPAIQMLTGAPYFDFENASKSADELWTFIDSQMHHGWMVTCASFTGTGSDQDTNSLGVPYRHAFTVNDTKQLSDGTKLIQIRNPWGSEKYWGPWSDKDYRWTEEFKKEVGLVDENDGLWWIDSDRYHSNFSQTSVNPNVSNMHLSYYALFDLEKDTTEQDTLTVTSDVTQTVYMSAYLYDSQHQGNGSCGDGLDDSSAYILSDHDNTWHYFKYGPYHYEAYTLNAGQTVDMTIETKFGSRTLLPSDYSFVVWSDVEPVNIAVTSAGHGASESFPQFKLSETVQIYDLMGMPVSNGSQGDGGSSGGSGEEGGEEGGETEYEVDPTVCRTCVDLPYISESADVEFHEKFQFDNGANWVTNNVEAISETEFLQNTSIVSNGDRFFFTTTYNFDGNDLSTTIRFEDGEIVCENTWSTDISTDIVAGDWHDCGANKGAEQIMTEVVTKFTEENSGWNVSEADLRAQIWLDLGDTYYSSYFDFDKLVMVAQFWRGGDMLTRTEWSFRNSQWDWSNRHADEQQEVDETVRDLWSDVQIVDNSDNKSDNVREYSIRVNDTYAITDEVEVKDPWNFEQILMFEKFETDIAGVFMQEVYYDGQIWRQSVTWDGYDKTSIEHSAQSETEGTADSTYAHPNGQFVFEQVLDITGYLFENSQTWFSKIRDTQNDMQWTQTVDLRSGSWLQQHWNSGVLIWEDTWTMEETLYNPWEDNDHDATTLAAKHARTASSGASAATIASTTLSILALGLVAYAYTQKRKVVSEKEEEINQPLL